MTSEGEKVGDGERAPYSMAAQRHTGGGRSWRSRGRPSGACRAPGRCAGLQASSARPSLETSLPTVNISGLKINQ